MNILSRAACRVDFSGGTADLWPLYLHLGNLELVHMAIQTFTEAKVSTTRSKRGLKITLCSQDLGCEKTFQSREHLQKSLTQSTKENPLRWVCRLVNAGLSGSDFTGSIRVETRSDCPPGSGLGGSSVLGVAVAKGLQKALRSKDLGPWHLQQWIRDLECIEIEHPAGDQDYVPALFGGLLVFHLGPNSRAIEKLPSELATEIGSRSALLYTGKPHHSGINNWQVFKAFHEGNKKVRSALFEIRDLSSQLASELRESNLKNFATRINDEWELRQQLSKAVQSDALSEAWTFAKRRGAIARKACGAGGGGSLLVVFPNAKAKTEALKHALPHAGWMWLKSDPQF
jgi:D-glycero-alpha-D-manno-heptose-7-phosphate kinase